MKTLTIKLLKDLDACQEGIDLVKNSNLEGFPLNRLGEVKGDYEDFVTWLKDKLEYIEIEYDTNGNIISKKELDYNGNVKWSYEYSYDENVHGTFVGRKGNFT